MTFLSSADVDGVCLCRKAKLCGEKRVLLRHGVFSAVYAVAHAYDSWYSHITEKTNYPDTKNVMIKITLRNGCYDIDKIELTAFVYDSEDDFDSDGFYRGADRATCIIGKSLPSNSF